MARLHRRYRKRKHKSGESKPRHNPPLLTDAAEFILPGFGAFAVTRFGTRVAATQIAKRFPKWGRHAGGAASVIAFLAAWKLAHRWKAIAKYQMPVMVGSGLAALQSLIQLYIPRLGWMVSDATPELAAGPAQVALPDGFEEIEEDLYDYDPPQQQHVPAGSAPAPAAQQQQQADDDLLSDLDLDEGQAQNMGIFGGN